MIKILIVEDEYLTAITLKKKLEKENYFVLDPVSKGEKAIEIAHIENPDIILMDIRLAGEMDGIETAKKIKHSLNIPIIFMTGFSTNDLKMKAEAVSPIAYLTKPLQLPAIAHAIQLALNTL